MKLVTRSTFVLYIKYYSVTSALKPEKLYCTKENLFIRILQNNVFKKLLVSTASVSISVTYNVS